MSEETLEFEREPVPEKGRLGLKSFLGQYVGEHVAGTELMIGPLFVAAGVSAFDLVGGLFLGNLLAVLSWTFLTAPIATRARLTLYYQLEKICGRRLVVLYDLANGIMFCFLAGAMVTVSATALGVPFAMKMPALTDLAPSSMGWILAVLAIGSMITIVAAYGYRTVAHIANISAPWMILVFVAFGVVTFMRFVHDTDMALSSLPDYWDFAKTVLWKGGEPQPGQMKFTFLHVMFFAWFCNMAMHIGMSDLSVFRFARKSGYGAASAAGMYVGHFMAWISASLLYAYQLFRDPVATTPLPGPMAYGACGLAGLLCVVVAGWTTANPTIYRAGLAFQAIAPRMSRVQATLLAGVLSTLFGLFPAVAMRLLDFVALYGMLLMPMGAVIFIDFWVLPRFGLISFFAEASKRSFNRAAGLAWIATLAGCLIMVRFCHIAIFFVSLPGWFLAALLYILASAWIQKKHAVKVIRQEGA